MTTNRQRREHLAGWSADEWREKILEAIGQESNFSPAIMARLCRLASHGVIDVVALQDALHHVSSGRRSGVILNPGGYLMTCVKGLYQSAGVDWQAKQAVQTAHTDDARKILAGLLSREIKPLRAPQRPGLHRVDEHDLPPAARLA